MALKLKDSSGDSYTNYYQDDLADLDSGSSNPWDNPKASSSMEPYQTTKSIKSTYVQEKRNFHVAENLLRLVGALVVVGVLIIVGKTIVSKLMPEGVDVTNMLSKPEMELEKELGVTFTDNTSWGPKMIQYSGGDLTIRANEDIGVVYINKKHVGLHLHTKQYKMYGIQVGMSEKKVNETLGTTFQFDNFLTIVDSGGQSGTTTYYYYRTRKNDCISIVIKNNTNRVDSITYYNNYKLIIKEADTF